MLRLIQRSFLRQLPDGQERISLECEVLGGSVVATGFTYFCGCTKDNIDEYIEFLKEVKIAFNEA